MARNQQVNDSLSKPMADLRQQPMQLKEKILIDTHIHILLERNARVRAKAGQDGALRTTLRNVLVLKRLRRRKCVILVKKLALVDGVVSEWVNCVSTKVPETRL
jgi:hypothetical protein